MDLSIIVPIYNVEDYLQECIESVIEQTFSNWELLLVDDGSTDGSGAIAQNYERQDARIRYFRQENSGQAAARNLGLAHAKGTFITFIDSDDYYIDNRIFEICIAYLRHNPEIDIVQFSHIHDGVVRNSMNATFFDKKEIWEAWFDQKLVTNYVWDKLFRRRLWETLRFPKGSVYEDRFVFPHYINAARGIALIDNIAYRYRTREGQTTGTASPFKLKGMVRADLEICRELPQRCYALYAQVLYRALSNDILCGSLAFGGGKLNIFRIMILPLPFGIKWRLSLYNIFGYKIYRFFFAHEAT